jgi:hypothetical protein
MGKSGNQRWIRLAVLGCWGLGLAAPSLAGPPLLQKAALHLEPRVSHVSLDLRPSIAVMAAFEKPSAAFPSGLHRQSMGAQEDIRLPSLGFESAQTPSRGRAQELVSRVRREGLPVARLWQNNSALVSLGLNQKGKPGLWLIQKIH